MRMPIRQQKRQLHQLQAPGTARHAANKEIRLSSVLNAEPKSLKDGSAPCAEPLTPANSAWSAAQSDPTFDTATVISILLIIRSELLALHDLFYS